MKPYRIVSHCFQFCAVIAAALLVASVAGAADVSFYGIIKGENYIQNTPTTPFLSENNSGGGGRFFFNAFVDLNSSNSVTNASVLVPISGAVKTLQLDPGGFSQEFHDSFEAPVFLDGTYPNGTYVLTLKTKNDGNKSINLAMSGTYASIPVVNNYNALQAVNPASSLNLFWTISGGQAADYVQLEIEEENPFGGSTKIYQSPQPGQTNALNGTAIFTNIVVNPPLSAGKIYKGRIMVARGVFNNNNSGYPGVSGVIGYTRRTEFPIVATGTPTDTDAPQFNTSSPYNGENNVPTNAVVGITFSERMKTDVSVASSIQWSGGTINGANFSYAWSPDSRTLYCVYNTSLPGNTTIQWTLNPTGISQNLQDLAGNKFSADYQGQFTTAATGSLGIKDVKKIFVYKAKSAFQTNQTAGPVASGMFQFGLSANLSAYNTVTNGTLTIPTGTPSILTPAREDYPYGDSFELQARYDSQANLDLFFPSGTYTVSLKTAHDGTKSPSASLTGNSYPNLPNISNFNAAQTVNSASSFTVNWVAFTGGGTNDYIQLQVENDTGDTIYQSGEPGDVGALTGTATSHTIPVGKLYPGRTYQARLEFIKVINKDTTSYPGVTFATAYSSETDFNLVTTGTPIQAQLSVLGYNSGQFSLRLTGEPKRSYIIEASDTMNSFTWYQVQYQNADDSGHIDFFDSSSFAQTHLFYRAREGSYNSGN